MRLANADSPALALWVLRRLLYLAPSDFRHAYGGEMVRLLRERYVRARRSSRLAGWRTLLTGIADVTIQAVDARVGRVRARWKRTEVFRWNLRPAWRAWRQSPGAALAVVVLPGLGIAGVAALVGALYSLLFAPLPFPRPDQLARIGGGIPLFNTYSSTFEQRDRLTPIFSHVMAYAPAQSRFDQITIDGPQRVNVEAVTAEFFETLGVSPQLGRSFGSEAVDAPVAVISDRLWQSAFTGSPAILGKTIRLGLLAEPVTVIGVMPSTFQFPVNTDVWVPMQVAAPEDLAVLQLVGRLQPELAPERGAAALAAIGYQRGTGPTGRVSKDGPVLQSLQGFLYGDDRPLLRDLCVVAVLFLLLACAGAVNLLLAHGVRRRPEMIVRQALGANRGQVVCQVLAETLVVVSSGGLLGLWLSAIVGGWLRGQWPQLRGDNPISSLGMLAVVAVASGAVTLVCGIGPALQASKVDVSAALKSRHGGITESGPRMRRLSAREFLAGVQLVLALALLIGAGLIFRSLEARLNIPLGLDAQDVAVLAASFPPTSGSAVTQTLQAFYQQHHLDPRTVLPPTDPLQDELEVVLAPIRRAQGERNVQLFRDAEERFGALPEVTQVGLLFPVPFTPDAARLRTQMRPMFGSRPPKGVLDLGGIPYVLSLLGAASPNAFDLLGIRLLAGRTFSPADVSSDLAAQEAGTSCSQCEPPPRVAIVNEVFARSMWPNDNAVGKQFYRPPFDVMVVGVVSNFRQTSVEPKPIPAVYYPFTGWGGFGAFVFKTRPGASVEQLTPSARNVIGSVAGGLLPADAQSLDDLTTASLGSLRLALTLLSTFSVLGAIVAALGMYMAECVMVAARTREIGIRMVLGASVAQIRGLALWRGLRLALVALPVGLLAGWGLARNLSHFLFQVGSVDALTYSVSAGVALLLTFAACLLPAQRAASVNPAVTLRED